MARILIVGATGRMGRMLTERFRACGREVSLLDRPLTPERTGPAAQDAGIALFCVPVAVMGDVLTRVLGFLPGGCILSDITSVKELPMRLMEQAWNGPVVGTHPLFGPNPQGERLPVAIVPGKAAAEEHICAVEALFTDAGFQVFRTGAREHDSAMARIQNLNFITNLVYFALLAGNRDLLPFLTPSFQRRLDASKKMLTEDAAMFAGLFEANTMSHGVVRQYNKLLQLAAAGDIDMLCRKAQWWWRD